MLVVLLAIALIVAACSGDTGGEAAVTAPSDAAGDQPVGDGSVAGQIASTDEESAGDAVVIESEDGDGQEPTSLAALEAQWAQRRAEIVADIEANGYGIDGDGVLIGPSGFQIDLNACPEGWSDTEGLGESITIGYTTAISGNLAVYGYVSDGVGAYFDHVNATGGIAGVPIELQVQDDEYKADRTVELVDEMVASGSVFAITTLGYPGTDAVVEQLNEACVPHPFAATSHPAWGDPVGHPWTTGLQLSHSTEAVLWGTWIERELGVESPIKVAALVRDDAFGLAYESGFRAWADAHPDVVSEFVAVRHTPSAAGGSVANEMATIRASEPDVFISMTSGDYCLNAVQDAAGVGLTESALALITPSVCRDPVRYMIPAGDAADGWVIVGGGIKATTDPRYADEPFIQFLKQTLTDAGLEPAVEFYGTGFGVYGWAFVESLRIAAELDGGLTRSNLILAQRSLDLTHPVVLDGVRFAMDGATDGFPVEGSNFGAFDAAQATWIEASEVIDVNGSTPSCSWDDEGC